MRLQHHLGVQNDKESDMYSRSTQRSLLLTRKLIAVSMAGFLTGMPWCHAAPRVDDAQAAEGAGYRAGGVTRDERDQLQREAVSYSLWLLTAMKQTGEYLSDVHVTVRDGQQQIVFDQLLDGPWLLMKLPDGEYEVVATYAGQRLHRHVKIRQQRQQKMYLHFGA